ncbi:MAG: universal stress protein [Nitrospinota bacterium]
MKRIRNILFPTDFSANSGLAKDIAISFAREYEAGLYVLNVIEPIYEVSDLYVSQFSTVDFYQEIEKNAKKEMDNLFTEEEKKVLKPKTVILQGTPFLEIINFAKEKEIDLIVIATHGRTGLDHVFFGSVSEKVVRKASCSVYVVKDKEKKFKRV